MAHKLTITIKGAEDKIFYPILEEEVVWETERKGAPSKLTFTVVKDEIISFSEGSEVRMLIDDDPVFFGYVFEKSRDRAHRIQCVCYDQLRYLKNRTWDTIDTGMSASDLLKMYAKQLQLRLGDIEDTGYVRPPVDIHNKPIIDAILDALDDTFLHTGELYVLYDNFGKITLKNIKEMETDFAVVPETFENFSYTSSIDKETYTRVLVVSENSDEKKRVVTTYDGKHRDKWGILQHVEVVPSTENPEHVAKTILAAKNRVSRDLKFTNCLGDLKVRGGSSVFVQVYIGDLRVDYPLLCEAVTHRFKGGNHTMDIEIFDSWDRTDM